MKNFIIVLLAVTILALPAVAGDEAQQYGKSLENAEAVKIAELLAKPDAYVGKPVRIKGKITDVCPMMGCWMDVEGKEPGSMIRIKVNDGEIVFPVEAKGKRVQAEGIFAKMELDAEKAERYLRHLAEEKGETFDPEAHSGPLVVYRIDGVGATIR